MYQENAARKDLSAYETGAMFRGWLAAKVFDGQTEIAAVTGLSEPSVSKYLTVAMLPKAVLEAFGDPRVIAVRWAERLTAAIKANGPDVLEAAREISREENPLKPDVVLNRLLDAAEPKKRKKVPTDKCGECFHERKAHKLSPKGAWMRCGDVSNHAVHPWVKEKGGSGPCWCVRFKEKKK